MTCQQEKTYTATKLKSMLETKYSSDKGYAFFTEISPGVGVCRRTDALAVGLYASHGHPVIGFEVKVSRGDWLAELKDASKADMMFQYCNLWYLVAAPGVVHVEELPMGWGLLEPVSRGLKIAIKAEYRDATAPTISFVSVLLRRDIARDPRKWVPLEEVGKLAEKSIDFQVECKTRTLQREVSYLKSQLERSEANLRRLNQEVKEYCAAVGLSHLSYASPTAIEKAVAIVSDPNKLHHGIECAKFAKENTIGALEALEQVEAKLREIAEAPR